MKSKVFLWVSMLLLSLTCLSSCSEDEDDNYADNYADNYKGQSGIVGTWYLIGASDGWGGYKQYNEGEIIIIFSQNGEMSVINTRDDQRPIATGTCPYYLTDVEKSIYTHEPKQGVNWGSLTYSLTFKDGKLGLNPEAFDAPGYTLKRTTKSEALKWSMH